MKVLTWIKTIGIMCIVFGALAVLNNVAGLAMSEMFEKGNGHLPILSPDLLKWKIRLNYIGILVYAVYLFAGIFFLFRKSFSLRLMYLALSLSILYQILPMLMLSEYNANPVYDYSFQVSKLIGPIIDLLLLVGVLKIAKHYYKSREELKALSGTKERTINPRRWKIITKHNCVF